MPRSVSIHPDRKQTVENALKRNGFLTQGDLAAHLDGMALSTVSLFFNAKNVSISTFEKICEALGLDKREIQRPLESSQDKAVKKTLPISSTLYDPEKWVGRSQLIERLLNKFQQKTRIVWLTGLSGIGKTTLGECIAVNAWENNPSFQWIHLEISASQLTDFSTGAREILSQLGAKDFDLQEMNDPKRLSNRLLQKLQSSFYWLQIDAVEKLIEANEFIDSYWLTFLESCLNTNHFSSRLLLTSQVLPNSLINWCDRFSNIWYQETLKGLENEESEQYFAKNGIIIDESNQTILSVIAQAYEGHPLVLQVITGEILQVYQGDVTAYWKVNQAEFEQVSRELKSSRLTETDYNEELARRVRERVKKSLEQLPEKAIALICRSAVYRRPVPKSFWLGLITEYFPKEQLEAYRILGDRALIETEKNLIRLHNLVRDISYDWLRENEIIWKKAEVKAAELWLNDYQPEENAENLEKVRGYLEAFYHYCDADDWESANNLFTLPLNNSIERLSVQLDIWGHYQEKINLAEHILGKVAKEIDISCWNDIGTAYLSLGEYNKTIQANNNSLNIAKEIGDSQGEADALGNLGIAYYYLGQQERAITFLQQQIELAKIIGDNLGFSNGLGSLAQIYSDQGQYSEAIDFFKQSLFISRKIGHSQGERSNLGNLGIVYRNLGLYKQAIEFHEQSLSISKKLYDRQHEGNDLGNIGNIYLLLGEYEKALKIYQERLVIAQEIGDVKGESDVIGNLGNLYYYQENYEKAFNLYQKSLEISKKIGNKKGEALALCNKGSIGIKLKKYDEAQTHLQAAITIFQDIPFPVGEATSNLSLAKLYCQTIPPNFNLARQHCEQALQIATELGIPLAQECQELLSKIEETEKNSE